MAKCLNCSNEYTPKVEYQKYCSNKCRLYGHNKRKYGTTNDTTNVQHTNTNVQHNENPETSKTEFYSSEMLDRLLTERDKYHQADKERIKAEYETKMLEARLTAIEKKMEEDDKPSMVEKFMTPEVISGLIQLATPKAPIK
jgi:hypothetical protein